MVIKFAVIAMVVIFMIYSNTNTAKIKTAINISVAIIRMMY